MSRKGSRKPRNKKQPNPSARAARERLDSGGTRPKVWLWVPALLVVALGAMAWWRASTHQHTSSKRHAKYMARPHGSITFNKEIAPIVFENCTGCHRPGESGPFNLLTYAEVSKRAKQIAEVTQSHFMPPWLPSGEAGQFLGDRRLTPEQIGLIQQWAAEGTPEGKASDLPPTPKWTDGWQLGEPDLVVTMPESYTLPAEGADVYRNFILPIPTTAQRFVRAVEVRPSSKAVHHAFIRIDASHESRRLDARDVTPGFSGMTTPPAAETPEGHFLGWQPGRGPCEAPKGLAWTLPAEADVVLLMHMQPRGTPETIRPSIGFWFTEQAPTNTPTKISLVSYDLDISAGATNQVVEQRLMMPLDTDLLSILPHAHYLGKQLEGFAILPDDTRKTLLEIPQWDFNWQSDFRYAEPVFLPKGTVLALRYTYDNSTNNVRNPNRHLQHVTYGLQTTNEMCELHFQLLPHDPADQAKLEELASSVSMRNILDVNRQRLRENPRDAEAVTEIAKVDMMQGKAVDAVRLLQEAVTADPGMADAHYTLGVALMDLSRYTEAEGQFVEAVRLDGDDYQASNNAGICALRLSRLDEAALYFQAALRVHPGDRLAAANLRLALEAKREKRKGRHPEPTATSAF